jgi:hypothetical protein
LPPSGIGRFLGLSLLALLALMVPWYYMANGLAAPAIELAGSLMHFFYPTWAEGVQRTGTVGVLLTRVGVYIPQQGQMLLADMTPEVNFLKYGYAVVLLWAMLLASRPPKWLIKIAIGTVVLVPVQAMSLCFHWLRDIAFQGGPKAQMTTHIVGWQLEAIAFAYQFSFLVLTPLAPVIIWLLLDKDFLKQLWVQETSKP